jgi:hypothetical protein
MAILVYSNGILEEYKSRKLVFSEYDFFELFKDFKKLRSYRLIFPINSWCLCGDVDDDEKYNYIASKITGEKICSAALFIHDSEINPDWNITDDILYDDYAKFYEDMKTLLYDIANEISENAPEYTPTLEPIGTTIDKKILFAFDIKQQPKEFYAPEIFDKFAERTYQYISKNKQEKEPFTIFSDDKAIIKVETSKVHDFLTAILEKFQSKEEYEICTNIANIRNEWDKIAKTKNVSSNKNG